MALPGQVRGCKVNPVGEEVGVRSEERRSTDCGRLQRIKSLIVRLIKARKSPPAPEDFVALEIDM